MILNRRPLNEGFAKPNSINDVINMNSLVEKIENCVNSSMHRDGYIRFSYKKGEGINIDCLDISVIYLYDDILCKLPKEIFQLILENPKYFKINNVNVYFVYDDIKYDFQHLIPKKCRTLIISNNKDYNYKIDPNKLPKRILGHLVMVNNNYDNSIYNYLNYINKEPGILKIFTDINGCYKYDKCFEVNLNTNTNDIFASIKIPYELGSILNHRTGSSGIVDRLPRLEYSIFVKIPKPLLDKVKQINNIIHDKKISKLKVSERKHAILDNLQSLGIEYKYCSTPDYYKPIGTIYYINNEYRYTLFPPFKEENLPASYRYVAILNE